MVRALKYVEKWRGKAEGGCVKWKEKPHWLWLAKSCSQGALRVEARVLT